MKIELAADYFGDIGRRIRRRVKRRLKQAFPWETSAS
jgi:hypothetical protein